jgi:Protein of unknown function (DUF1761)
VPLIPVAVNSPQTHLFDQVYDFFDEGFHLCDERKFFSDGAISLRKPIWLFGLSFLLTLIISFNLAAFLGSEAGLIWGMTAGALAGIGWVATSLGILYLFESRSLKLFLINAGYLAIAFIVAGGIIGAWQ